MHILTSVNPSLFSLFILSLIHSTNIYWVFTSYQLKAPPIYQETKPFTASSKVTSSEVYILPIAWMSFLLLIRAGFTLWGYYVISYMFVIYFSLKMQATQRAGTVPLGFITIPPGLRTLPDILCNNEWPNTERKKKKKRLQIRQQLM